MDDRQREERLENALRLKYDQRAEALSALLLSESRVAALAAVLREFVDPAASALMMAQHDYTKSSYELARTERARAALADLPQSGGNDG